MCSHVVSFKKRGVKFLFNKSLGKNANRCKTVFYTSWFNFDCCKLCLLCVMPCKSFMCFYEYQMTKLAHQLALRASKYFCKVVVYDLRKCFEFYLTDKATAFKICSIDISHLHLLFVCYNLDLNRLFLVDYWIIERHKLNQKKTT